MASGYSTIVEVSPHVVKVSDLMHGDLILDGSNHKRAVRTMDGVASLVFPKSGRAVSADGRSAGSFPQAPHNVQVIGRMEGGWAEGTGSVSTPKAAEDPKPADLRTKAGRAWKARQKALQSVPKAAPQNRKSAEPTNAELLGAAITALQALAERL